MLAARGIITPETPLATDTGHRGTASQIPGLQFGSAAPSPFVQTAQPVQQNVSVPAIENEKSKKPLICVLVLSAVVLLVVFGFNMFDFGYFDSPSATMKRFATAIQHPDEKTVAQTTTPEVFKELQSRGIIKKLDDGGFWVASIDGYTALRHRMKGISHTIDGNTANVDVVFYKDTKYKNEYGTNDATSTESVGFVKVGGRWKISELRGLFGNFTQSASRNSASDTLKRIVDEQQAKIDVMQQRGEERVARFEQEIIDTVYGGERPRSLDSRVTSVAFSPDGKKIVTASYGRSNTAQISEVDSKIVLQTLEGHTETVNTASFSPDGKKIVTAGRHGDNTARIWDAETGKELQKLEGMRFIESAAFSPDSRKIVTASDSVNGTIRIWDTDSGRELKKLEGIRLPNSASFSPDGKKIVMVVSSTVRIWDAELDNELHNLEITRSPYSVGNAVFSPDGKKIVTVDNDGNVRILDAETGKELQRIRESVGTLMSSDSVSFSPDGKKIIWVYDNIVKFRDVE